MRNRALSCVVYGLLTLWPSIALAVNANPKPGALWTYFGPTLGADWLSGSLTPPIIINDSQTGAITTSRPGPFIVTSNGTLPDSLVGANVEYNSIAGVQVNNPGSSLINLNAVAGYVFNNNPNGGFQSNSVALYGWGQGNVAGSWTWGANPIVISTAGISAGTHLIGEEVDINASNANDNAIGILLAGGSAATPGSSVAIALAPIGLGHGNTPWGAGFFSQPGGVMVGVELGPLSVSGTNINSQSQFFNVYDSGGLTRSWIIQGSPTALNFFSSVITTPSFQFNGNVVLTTGRTYNLFNNVALALASGVVSLVPDVTVTSLVIGNLTTTTSIVNLVTAAGAGAATKYVCVDASGNTVVQVAAC